MLLDILFLLPFKHPFPSCYCSSYVCPGPSRPSGSPRQEIPDSKVHGANMGPIWGRQDPGGPHVGPMSLAIWDMLLDLCLYCCHFLAYTSMDLWMKPLHSQQCSGTCWKLIYIMNIHTIMAYTWGYCNLCYHNLGSIAKAYLNLSGRHTIKSLI